MILWFIAIGGVGIYNIALTPKCLEAWNPHYIGVFFSRHGWKGFKLLGSIVLVITGVEAFYADMGHFGRSQIRVGWTFLVFPSLLLCYFGQAGQMLTRRDEILDNIFYKSIPGSLYWPMIVLTTVAAVIASQSIVSGTFSLIYQAIAQHFFPPIEVSHTSRHNAGQVYVPVFNYILLLFSIFLVVFFKNSTDMTSAFAVAVMGTISITTILYVVMVVTRWPWLFWIAIPVGTAFFLLDMALFISTLNKVPDGGWVPLIAALFIFATMLCWWLGYMDERRENKLRNPLPLHQLGAWLTKKQNKNLKRTKGTGIFIEQRRNTKGVMMYAKIAKTLPSRTVILNFKFYDVPKIEESKRLQCYELGDGLYYIKARFGFRAGKINIWNLIEQGEAMGVIHPEESKMVKYFIVSETLANSRKKFFWVTWRLDVYNAMARLVNWRSMLALPYESMVEIGSTMVIKPTGF